MIAPSALDESGKPAGFSMKAAQMRVTDANAAKIAGVDLVFDVLGGDIGKRSARLIRTGGTLVSIAGPPEAWPDDGLAVDLVVESDRARL